MSVIEAEVQPAEMLVQMGAEELTTAEHAELVRYEAVIRRGLETFLDVGRALMAIRDQKLYRATHATFDDYCRGTWNISRQYAYRQINAAQVVEILSPIGDILPTNEAQARPLAKLEPDQQREAWADAVEVSDGKPTMAHVEKAAAKFAEPKPVAPREVKRLRDETRKPEVTPAKAVYVEPTDAEEAAAIAEVAAEREQEEAERLELNRRGGMLTSAWIVDTLSRDDPAHPYFRSALKGASADDVREAMASLSTEDKFCDARLAALKARFGEMEPPPATVTLTIRRELAEELLSVLTAFRVADLTLVDQDELAEALTLVLEGSAE